jgi:hypothetical protein
MAQLKFEIAGKETGREFAREFADFVNTMGDGREEHAIKKMLREHRTLQQSMMRFCMKFIEGVAAHKCYDPRNVASVMLAREIVTHLENRDEFGTLPTI